MCNLCGQSGVRLVISKVFRQGYAELGLGGLSKSWGRVKLGMVGCSKEHWYRVKLGLGGRSKSFDGVEWCMLEESGGRVHGV